jgi:hypothetical protein
VHTPGSCPTDVSPGERVFLISATPGSQGLRLLVSKPVDAEPGTVEWRRVAVADEIKKVRPRLPIVMLAESLELAEGALKSVDVLVTSSDGTRFLLEAIDTVLQARDRQHFDTASAEQAEQRGEETMPTPQNA